MEISSNFRTLFLVRVNFVFVVVFIVCSYFVIDGFTESNFIKVIISIILLSISAYLQFLNLGKIFKIKVSAKGINKTYFFYDKHENIPFSSIKSVRLEKVDGLSTDAGKISLGYYESVMTLDNDETLILSPDKYENYHEIMKSINHFRQNEID